MEITKVISTISEERFASYQKRYPQNLEKSFLLYQSNIEISQAFYSSLSILEISLRNAINDSFAYHFKTENWFKYLPPEIHEQILIVEKKLTSSKKEATVDKIISELNFGFWTTLYNRKYAKDLWKPLLRATPYLSSAMRKRTKVSSRLNHIRTFRNRIYHYEPIIWDIQEIITKRREIFEMLRWIEPETEKWALSIDQFEDVKNRIKEKL